MFKIKEIFNIGYAFELLVSEDGFTLNKVQLNSADPGMVEKNEVKIAESYFKLQAVHLLYDLFFSKSHLGGTNVAEFDKVVLFLVEFERYRFDVMTFQTKLLSYETIYDRYEKNTDLYSAYLPRLIDSDLLSNYKKLSNSSELENNCAGLEKMGSRC